MKNINKLKNYAKKCRIDCLKMTHKAKSSHIGSCFSIVEILVILYFKFLNIKEKNNFIMSKGHAAAALYSILSLKKFFKRSLLKKYCSNGFKFSGHVNHNIRGVFLSTGALGHGLPVASGLALAKKKNDQNRRASNVKTGRRVDNTSVIIRIATKRDGCPGRNHKKKTG